MENTNLITDAIDFRGLKPLADDCGVVYQAVRKWEKNGLPRTEYTGETNYAQHIERVTNGSITAEQLLAWSKTFRQQKSA